jgi:hypothetical protein
VVRLDTSFLRDSERNVSGFYIPAVVATTISLRDLKDNICAKTPGALVIQLISNISIARREDMFH